MKLSNKTQNNQWYTKNSSELTGNDAALVEKLALHYRQPQRGKIQTPMSTTL